MQQPFSDFQIGGKCNDEKNETNLNSLFVPCYLVSVIHPQMTWMKLLVIEKGEKEWMERSM